jgi:pimeloyl-ACP methyl ester carboxylesterase
MKMTGVRSTSTVPVLRRSLLLGGAATVAAATLPVVGMTVQQDAQATTGLIDIGSDLMLRRMIVRHPSPKGTVLLLHGFPETLHAWSDISLRLAANYEVHAFDWPGYGLSSRPLVEDFAYAPKDYARVLEQYIGKVGIDKSRLTIYATDIGALPVLLLALDEPRVARRIIVGDFAPFDRPQYMNQTLQALKSRSSADAVHAAMNKNRDEILENSYRRGLPKEEQFDLSPELKKDMLQGWDHGNMTSADAFFHYYSNFTRDQDYFESRLTELRSSVKVVWGEKDFYIQKGMGIEFADKAHLDITIFPRLGHYPHLQDPDRTIEEIRTASEAS